MNSLLRTKSMKDTSEPGEDANELTKRTLWTKTAKLNTSKSLSASIPSPPGLGPDRFNTPGQDEGYVSPWFWTDDEYIFLISTPFTYNVPSFRHGPIRLFKAGLVNADNIDVLDWKLLYSLDETLDWTAFHVLGGVGEFSSESSGSRAADETEELLDDLYDWLGDLGYSGHSSGALVFEEAFVRNYRERTEENTTSPANDWADVYRALSDQQKQDPSHVISKAPDPEGASDIMSMISYAESIFDAGATMSTASSVPGDTQELVSKFVDILVRDASVARMASMALSNDGMGQERFRRNFGRILRSYSRELRRGLEKGKPEGYDASYAHAAAFVSRKAPHASQLIVSRFSQARKSMPPRNGLADSDGAPSSGSEESEGENDVLITERLESFFTNGEPFRLLKWRLRALVYPDSFLSRVRDSTGQLVRIASGCGLTGLLFRAQQQQFQTPENLRADFTEQVECLARDLRVQCSTSGQIRVADFLRVHSQYVAARLIDSTTPGKESDSKRSSISDGILEDIVANTPPDVWEMDFQSHWAFITSTQAFQDFLNDLRDLAYPTLFSRARKLIAKSNEPEYRRLLPILAEMQWAIECRMAATKIKSTFRISPEQHCLADRLKLAVEASTGAQWDWWPLCSPPRYQAYNSLGGEILSWICPCGMLRRERISPKHSNMLRDLAETLPLSLPANLNIPSISLGDFRNHTSQGLSDSATDDSSSESRSSRNSLSSGSTPMTGFSSAGNSVAISIGDNEIERFVFILVLDSRYHLITTDVSEMSSLDFFQALTAEYNAHRGVLRRMFSIFIYSHCDFVQIKRWAPKRFAPGSKFSFPPSDDDSYRYSPQPMLEPPISAHQFHELYYSCYDSEKLSHRLHNILSTLVPVVSTCDVLSNISDEFLLCLPKRDTPVNSTGQFGKGDRCEIFWGLVARERRSTARVMMYTLASLVPSLVFAFGWMFAWDHSGDLQNASVPFTITCSMLGLLWAVVYSGSDSVYG